jgi:hypothetical protein
MCDIQTLTDSEHGYVIYCRKCRVLQLAFGFELVMNINEEDFLPMVEYVATRPFSGMPDHKEAGKVLLQVNRTRYVSLSRDEVGLLIEMLTGAGALFEAYQIYFGMEQEDRGFSGLL